MQLRNMRSCWWNALPTLATVLILTSALAAYSVAQEKGGTPRLVLHSGGPVAPVRCLAFAAESDLLFSAGDDKVCRAWRIAPDGSGVLQQELRWEIARGHRGAIHTMAVAPRGDRVAFGGISARDASGDIVVYDTATGELERVLKRHRQGVVSLAFSPDGSKLASVSRTGEVLIWSAPAWTSVLLRGEGSIRHGRQPAMFFTDNLLAVSAPAKGDAANSQVSVYDITRPEAAPGVGEQVHQGHIMAMAWDNKKKVWATADESGQVFVWKGMKSSTLRPASKTDVLAMSFGGDGRLLTSTSKPSLGASRLELWDALGGKLIDSIPATETDHTFACAASPDGRWGVAYAADESSLNVFPLSTVDDKGAIKAIPKPLTGVKPERLVGAGSKIWSVAFDWGDSYRIGFGKRPHKESERKFGDHGPITEAFELKANKLVPVADKEGEWRTADAAAGGWKLRRQGNGSRIVLIKDDIRATISLDQEFQGQAHSYCWLANAKGETYGLAIGTNKQHGVWIYGLPKYGKCEILRYGRDHQGWVTSLSVSKDGKYLASSSIDQTVKIWSLADIEPKGGKFARQHAWGAVFENVEGKIVITEVNEAGIVARRKLKKGDTIIALRYSTPDGVGTASTPAQILDTLNNVEVWGNVLFSVKSPDEADVKRSLLVPGWEPLATLFVANNGEWAYWTPQGFYNASVAGDELFGWQLNQGREFKPRFLRADQLRGTLEKPQVMQELLTAGNITSALKVALGATPKGAQDHVSIGAEATPEIQLVGPLNNVQFAKDDEVEIVAKVDFPVGHKVENYDLTAYVNGVPSEPIDRKVTGKLGEFRWRATPVNRNNRVRVVVERTEDSPFGNFAFADVFVKGETVDKKHKLHILTLAANKYPGDLKLLYAVDDAASLVKSLEEKSGELFEVGMVKTLADEAISPRSVDQTITEVRETLSQVAPDDLLIVFVAGHGLAKKEEYFFIPPSDKLKDGLGDFDLDTDGVSWRLLRRLAAVRCRKVFLLDTCFAGNVTLAESGSDAWKSSIRPLRRSEALVLTATGIGESSYEIDELKHGVFTYCLLDAINGKADGRTAQGPLKSKEDGAVDLSEIIAYVAQEVPQLTSQKQHPNHSPSFLGYVPLTPVR